MLNSVATVEDNDAQVDQNFAQSEQLRTPGAGAMRFVYTTGSRPLDGFTIKRGIGIGGFGEVYFALSDGGKEVALKRIQRSMDVEVRGASQCLNLKHQNLISLYDIRYDDEGQGWVVMEYVAGESLKDAIERYPEGMPEDQVWHWFRGIAAGVAYLHDHGIIHRDLKPANIFIDEGVVKIGDYGLSKFISCSRRSGQTESVGTFHYMAPEIGKGVYGKEIDIYALGIMLCEMLTGRVPIDGESSQEIIMKHLTATPELSGVAERYRPIVERALAKDPARRFRNVAEFLGQVESAYRGVRVKPPVRTAPVETIYIGEEVSEHEEGIFLGPVRESREGAQAATAETPNFRVGPSEPVARSVWTTWQHIKVRWDDAKLTTPVKLLLLFGLVLLFMANASWILPLGFMLVALYLPYLAIYSLVATQTPAVAAATATPHPPAAPARPVPPRHAGADAGYSAEAPPAGPAAVASPPRRCRSQGRTSWQNRARAVLRERTLSERMGELSGSLLSAALVSCVISFIMVVIGGINLESVYTWTLFAWMAIASTAGAWGVLAISKFWEGSSGESIRRRFVMLIVGLLVGAAAFGGSQYLALDAATGLAVSRLPDVDSWAAMYDGTREPKLPAFLVYFGGILVASRWWLQADPLRKARLSIFATAFCVLWAWLVDLVWPFPQPWGLMIAATISIAVQLAAPWMSSGERNRIRNQVTEI